MSIVDDLVQQAIALGRMTHELELLIVQRKYAVHEAEASETSGNTHSTNSKHLPRGQLQQRIVEHVDSHGECRVKEIATALGNHEDVVRQAVLRLVKAEVLERKGRLVKRKHPV